LRGQSQVYRDALSNSPSLHIVGTGLHESASVDHCSKEDRVREEFPNQEDGLIWKFSILVQESVHLYL
jgi:hypothetical protein